MTDAQMQTLRRCLQDKANQTRRHYDLMAMCSSEFERALYAAEIAADKAYIEVIEDRIKEK